MLYCANPQCSNPFSPDGSKFCVSCGSQPLTPLFRHRYRVMRLLGEGGFGRTYEARDTDKMDDPCVIKQFMPQVQGTAALEKATKLFQQEAQRLYELGEHPQIPRLVAYFEQDQRLYLVQELIEGQNLLQELQQQGSFSEEKIKQLLADLLPVLKFVHENGVIHRDIKPENIMRRRFAPSSVSKNKVDLVLIDFGVSSTVETVGADTIVGTPGYAPIEQMRGQVFPASDLYSLGITCIRLLTNCLPNDGIDKLYDAINGRWLWRKRLPKGVTISPQLGLILDNLIRDDVQQRYQSANEVLEVLNYVYLEQEIFNKLSTIISRQLKIAVYKITFKYRLSSSRANELDVLELIIALEEEFDIEIPDEDYEAVFKLFYVGSLQKIKSYQWLGHLVTVKDVVDYILERIQIKNK